MPFGNNSEELYQNNRLASAITWGNITYMKEVIDAGANLEDFTIDKDWNKGLDVKDYPKTALGYAMGSGTVTPNDFRAIQLLIDQGVNVNVANKQGETYLHTSLANAESEVVVKALLDNGANPNAISKNDETPLEVYLKKEYKTRAALGHNIISLLLQHGAQVRTKTLEPVYRNYDRITLESIQSLVENAVANGVETGLGNYADMAVMGDFEGLKAELKNHSVMDGLTQREGIKLVVDFVAAYGAAEEMKALSNDEDALTVIESRKDELLYLAAKHGNISNVEYLLGAGADINYAKDIGEFLGETSLLAAIKNNHYDVAKFLLDEGATFYIDQAHAGADDYHNYELANAAASGNTDIVDLVLEYKKPQHNETYVYAMNRVIDQTPGKLNQDQAITMLAYLINRNDGSADPASGRIEAISPLEIVAGSGIGNVEVMQFLIESGAKVEGYEEDGDPLYQAVTHGIPEAVQLLLNSGADPNQHLGLVNLAIMNGDLDKADLLLNNGAEIMEYMIYGVGFKSRAENEAYKDDGTFLHELVFKGSSDVMEYALQHVPKEMMDKAYEGSKPSKSMGMGDTPLHVAVALGNKEVVNSLLRAGADATIQNEKGKTAFDLAKKGKNKEIVQVFNEHGIM